MPFYEYRCDKGHTFEVRHGMTDDPVTECEQCGKPVQRVFHPVAVHFKGSGFYNTDYGKKGSKADKSAESKSEKKSEKKAEKKTETKSSTD